MEMRPFLDVYTHSLEGSQNVIAALSVSDLLARIDRQFAAYLAEADHHHTIRRAGRAASCKAEAVRLQREENNSAARIDSMEAEIRDLAGDGVSPVELAAPAIFELFWLTSANEPLAECGKDAAFLLSLLHRLRPHLTGCLREIVDDVLSDPRRAIGETLLGRGRPAQVVVENAA